MNGTGEREVKITRPSYIKIETTNICNGNCAFCIYHKAKRAKSVMSDELFTKCLDDYGEIGGGNLTLYPMLGEVFCDPKFLDRLEEAQRHKAVNAICVYTNGVALMDLTEEDRWRFVNNINSLHFSVAPNAEVYKKLFRTEHYEKVVQGILWVTARRPKQMSMLRVNIKTWNKPYKVDPRLAPHVSHTAASFHDWVGELTDPIEELHIDPSRPKTEGPCGVVLLQIAILSDGTVCLCAACSQEGQMPLGNLAEESLESIVYGEKRARYIESFVDGTLNTYCQRCTFYKPARWSWEVLDVIEAKVREQADKRE